MTEFSTTGDQLTSFEEPKKIPDLLNVVTILTFIGCAIGAISSFYSFFTAKKSYDSLEQVQSSGQLDKAPDFVKKMAGPEMLEMARKSLENKVPILIIGLVGIALCFYGAWQMRKFKKQGYYVWLIGEILPIVATFVFIGSIALTPMFSLGLIVPIIFIILYTTQLKHLR